MQKKFSAPHWFAETEEYYLKDLPGQMNFIQLNDNVEDTIIRIWASIALVNFDQVTIVKKNDTDWEISSCYYYRKEWDRLSDIDSFICRKIETEFTISTLIDSMLLLGLDTLPNQFQIRENFVSSVSDGSSYFYQYSVPGYSHHFFYHCPELEPHRFDKAAYLIFKLRDKMLGFTGNCADPLLLNTGSN